jgi:hypothetical protein
MDVREIRWEGVDWIQLAQDRGQWRDFVNTAGEFLDYLSEYKLLNNDAAPLS